MALYDVQLLSMTIPFGLTLGIRANMTLKQVSKATCSWLDPLSELHIMYHNGIPTPMAFGATAAYNGKPNWFVLNVESIAQELFIDNRSHISYIHSS